MKIKNAVTIFHYPKDGLNGDYSDVELVIELDETVRREIRTLKWGDDYHDKGQDRADAVVLALQTLFWKFPHEEKHIDDREVLD